MIRMRHDLQGESDSINGMRDIQSLQVYTASCQKRPTPFQKRPTPHQQRPTPRQKRPTPCQKRPTKINQAGHTRLPISKVESNAIQQVQLHTATSKTQIQQ